MELYILAVGIYCDFFLYIELYILLFIENLIWNSIKYLFFSFVLFFKYDIQQVWYLFSLVKNGSY